MTIFSITVNIYVSIHLQFAFMILKTISQKLSYLVCSILFLTITTTSHAAQWEINPTVEARMGYSDNIRFDDSDDEESGFIGAVNPGVTIQKNEGRLRVNLDYLMQNFYYIDDSDLSTDHSLDSIARYEFIPQTFFLNGYAIIRKELVDSGQGLSVDNLNDTGNTADETTLGIEPVWVQNIGTHTQADLAYLYATQSFDEDTDDDADVDVDDNDRQRFLGNLGNRDKEGDRLDWALGIRDESVDFDDGEEFDFSSVQGELGYDVNSRIKLVGTYGYEDNDFGDIVSIDEDEDGVFWDLGFIYGFGEFTSLELRRGERFFGNTWKADLNVGGPKLAVNASYEETTDLGVLDSINDDGFNTAEDLLQNDIDNNIANNRDSVSISKTWVGTVTYRVSKSTFAFNLTNDDAEFLDSNDRDKFESYAFGWLWDINGTSALFNTVEWEDLESDDGLGIEDSNDLFRYEIVYTRRLSAKTNFDVNYIYTEGSSDTDDDGDFTSNTISAGLIYSF
jgi:uncharacterized protein (PEP-CTERM system associated)